MSDSTNDAQSANAQVVIYSTPTCAFCRTEKQWLESLGVSYISRDIEEDQGAQDELLAKLDGNFQGVPTTTIGDEVIIGFNRPLLQEALKKNNLLPA